VGYYEGPDLGWGPTQKFDPVGESMAEPKDPRLDELERRREFNAGKQVDNSRLYAGSPMYYYCETCGAHVATKPEGWYLDPPPKHCANCKDDIKDGIIAYTNLYTDWLQENGKERYAPRE
jgi:hypothetical protein